MSHLHYNVLVITTTQLGNCRHRLKFGLFCSHFSSSLFPCSPPGREFSLNSSSAGDRKFTSMSIVAWARSLVRLPQGRRLGFAEVSHTRLLHEIITCLMMNTCWLVVSLPPVTIYTMFHFSEGSLPLSDLAWLHHTRAYLAHFQAGNVSIKVKHFLLMPLLTCFITTHCRA